MLPVFKGPVTNKPEDCKKLRCQTFQPDTFLFLHTNLLVPVLREWFVFNCSMCVE